MNVSISESAPTMLVYVRPPFDEYCHWIVGAGSANAAALKDAVMPAFTEEILKKRNLKAPVGEVKALPDSAYTGS